MRTDIERRLQQLLTEREAGQRLQTDLDNKRASLTQTLLRIDGAIQVLRELLDAAQPAVATAPADGRNTAPGVELA